MEGRERGALAYEGEIWREGRGGHSLMKVRYGGKGEGALAYESEIWREGRGGHSLMKVRYGGKGRVRKRNIFSVRFCR